MAFFQFQELAQTLIENIFKASAFRIELCIVIEGIQLSTRPEDFLEMFIIGLGFFIELVRGFHPGVDVVASLH